MNGYERDIDTMSPMSPKFNVTQVQPRAKSMFGGKKCFGSK